MEGFHSNLADALFNALDNNTDLTERNELESSVGNLYGDGEQQGFAYPGFCSEQQLPPSNFSFDLHNYELNLDSKKTCLDDLLSFSSSSTSGAEMQPEDSYLSILAESSIHVEKPVDVIVGMPAITSQYNKDFSLAEQNSSPDKSKLSFGFKPDENLRHGLGGAGSYGSAEDETRDLAAGINPPQICRNSKGIFVPQDLHDTKFPIEVKEEPLDEPQDEAQLFNTGSYNNQNNKAWSCTLCGKRFRHQYTLTRHLPTHTDVRNFKCETCGKAFRQMSTLSQHRAIHSDARPYICEYCRKTFNRVSTLISHKKTHSSCKPHKCHICHKAFHQKGNLRNHIFTHTNERPYKCDICWKGFNQMSNLMCHKVHTHAEKGSYPCVQCGQVFSKRLSLRAHEERSHDVKYPCRMPPDLPNLARTVGSSRDPRTVTLPKEMYEEQQQQQQLRHPLMQLDLNPIVMASSSSGGKVTGRSVVASGRTAQTMSSALIIDRIKTEAMQSALSTGQVPFVLYKPLNSVPVLVKVLNTMDCTKHMLVPVKTEDLKKACQITVCPKPDSAAKALQFTVPVVATVKQWLDDEGRPQLQVQPPTASNSVKTSSHHELYCETLDEGLYSDLLAGAHFYSSGADENQVSSSTRDILDPLDESDEAILARAVRSCYATAPRQ